MTADKDDYDAHRSALLLTDDEWTALRWVASYYLHSTHNWAPAERLDLCQRIMEVTE